MLHILHLNTLINYLQLQNLKIMVKQPAINYEYQCNCSKNNWIQDSI